MKKHNFYAKITTKVSGQRKGKEFPLGYAVQGDPLDLNPFLCIDGLAIVDSDEYVIPWTCFRVFKSGQDVTEQARKPFIKQAEENLRWQAKCQKRELKERIAQLRRMIKYVRSGQAATELEQKLQELDKLA